MRRHPDGKVIAQPGVERRLDDAPRLRRLQPLRLREDKRARGRRIYARRRVRHVRPPLPLDIARGVREHRDGRRRRRLRRPRLAASERHRGRKRDKRSAQGFRSHRILPFPSVFGDSIPDCPSSCQRPGTAAVCLMNLFKPRENSYRFAERTRLLSSSDLKKNSADYSQNGSRCVEAALSDAAAVTLDSEYVCDG